MKTLVHGTHYTPMHLFSKISFPIDIDVIEGVSTVRYIGVTKVNPTQYGFEFICHGVNPVECKENYAVKKYVKEIWLKTDAFGVISSYQALKRVNVINPRFILTTSA